MTATTIKQPNYTEAQTAELLAAYKANPTKETVDMLAVKFAKSTRSIVAKLSRLEVYQKPERVAKNITGKPVTKENVADSIASILNGVVVDGTLLTLSDAETDSLAKTNKTALLKVFKALAFSKPVNAA